MRTVNYWTPVATALAVLSLIAGQLAPEVLAQDAAARQNTPAVADISVRQAIAQAIPQLPTPTVAARIGQVAPPPAAQDRKSKTRKWVLIAAAAVGAGVAAAMLTRGGKVDVPERPQVTVGPPSIGQAQ